MVGFPITVSKNYVIVQLRERERAFGQLSDKFVVFSEGSVPIVCTQVQM